MAANINTGPMENVIRLPRNANNTNVTRKVKKLPQQKFNVNVSDPYEQYSLDLEIMTKNKYNVLKTLETYPPDYLMNYIRFDFYPKETKETLYRLFKAMSLMPIMGKEQKECCRLINLHPTNIRYLLDYVESIATDEETADAEIEKKAKELGYSFEKVKDFDLILQLYFQISQRRIAFYVLHRCINHVYTTKKEFEEDLGSLMLSYKSGVLFDEHSPSYGADDVIFDYSVLLSSK